MLKSLCAALFAVAVAGAVACESPDDNALPVAPPSRHAALRDALTTDARGLSFQNGDWLEDLGDAPFYGLAWLSRRAAAGPLPADDAARLDASLARARTLLASDLLSGDIQEKVMAALGIIEHVDAFHDPATSPDVAAVDAFLDRLDHLVGGFGDYLAGTEDTSWAVKTYGPTSVTALIAIVHAQYALYIDGEHTRDHQDRAISLEQTITDRALADLVDVASGKSARAYAFGPNVAGIDLYPNVSMILLESRLFRLTKNETYRLQARSLYGAIQALKLSDMPARYESPYAIALLGAKTRNVATLSSQNYLALSLMTLFEITGDRKFVDEADRVLDAIETMRGPWCLAQVHKEGSALGAGEVKETCKPACSAKQACVTTTCTADRCTTGLLHHVVDGRLALPTDPVLFCSGCNLQTLYVVGYRRAQAGEPF